MDRPKIMQNISYALTKLRTGHRDRPTQKDIAHAIGVDLATYNRSEAGKREVSIYEIFCLAEYYEISPTNILELIQQTPADLSRIKQLQLHIEEALKENRFLKDQLEAERQKAI